MKYRKFKEVNISEVGLGTWQLGSSDWGAVNEDHALELLQKFSDLGGNFIDTADVYGMGISEKVIGTFIDTVDKKFYIASKLGRRHDGENGWPQNFSYESMHAQVNDSLTNLKQGRLFLEQLHCIPKNELEQGHVFDVLRRLKQENLIEHWGASVETAEEARICLQQEGISSIQIIFNLFRQHYAEDFFEEAKEKDVAIIARVPLASGLLSGKFKKDTQFSPGDHRNYNANGEMFNVGETFSGVELSQGITFAHEIARHFPDERTAQWAIRWILDHPEITTVIPGASKYQQVISNMSSSDLSPLSAALHDSLAEYYYNTIQPSIRGHY
jgi:aryl-alcohol dehydrogenase-like predicted oxidoreductase